MSLQVWLPLNGDLHNQGLNGSIIATSIGTLTYDNNGKIGKCYQRATTSTQNSNGIQLNTNFLNIFNTTASVAMWVKPLGTHTHYNGTLLSSGNWNQKRWAFGISQDNTQVDVLCGGYNTFIDCTVPVNEWTHLCSTFDNGVSKLYKNGIYIGELTGKPNFDSDATTTCIGRETYASGYFGFNGLINDVRIYDHCLSAKEIEEIAKGLILHYKLDNNGLGNPNLALHTRDLSVVSSKDNLNMFVRGSVTRQLRSDGFYESKATASWRGLSFWANQLNLTPGTKATYSFYIYTNGSSRAFSFYPMMYDSAGTRDTSTGLPISIDGGPYTTVNAKAFPNTTATTPEYHYVTFEWNQAVADIISNGGSIELSIQVHGNWASGDWASIFAPKVEFGDKPTPWCFHPSELLFNNNIICDSSGYNNNGTIVGSLKAITPNPRYGCATHLESSSPTTNDTVGLSYIQTPLQINTPVQMTVCWWAKPENGYNNTTNHAAWCTSSNSQSPVDYNSTAFHHRDNRFDICLNSASTTSLGLTFNNYTKNEWHYYCVVYDGKNAILYKDGIETNRSSISSTEAPLKSFTNLYIGFSAAGGVRRKTLGAYSDFRIYVIALTAEQIKELYNTSATIDKNSNIYAREQIENFGDINITKTGQLQSNKIVDDNTITIANFKKSDKSINGNTVYEY